MFVHAETDPAGNTKDGDMNAFMRLGTDYTKNYYEIEAIFCGFALPVCASNSPCKYYYPKR